MRRCASVVGTTLVLALSRTAFATAQTPAPRHCFESGPLPRCKTFWLTEFGGGIRFASNDLEARSSLFQWNLGFMRNLNHQTALGGSAFLTWSESNVTAGVAPRLRFRVSPIVSVDVAPGVVVFQGGSRNFGFNGQVGINIGPNVAVTSTVQVTNSGYFDAGGGRPRVEWFGGVRFGGWLGAATGVATPILTFITYLIVFSQLDD